MGVLMGNIAFVELLQAYNEQRPISFVSDIYNECLHRIIIDIAKYMEINGFHTDVSYLSDVLCAKPGSLVIYVDSQFDGISYCGLRVFNTDMDELRSMLNMMVKQPSPKNYGYLMMATA
jgi:hypothetical protein